PGMANGLANMHNARRAHTPMVNVVGDHASYHLQYDAPLTSDIESLATPMSDWVRRIASADDVSAAAAAAISAANSGYGAVTTLTPPVDAAWTETSTPIQMAPPVNRTQVAPQALRAATEAPNNGRNTVILLSGKALRSKALET